MALELEILIPEKKLVSEQVDSVVLETLSGEIGVLPGHCSLLSGLTSGVLRYEKDGKEELVAVHYGYVQIYEDKVTVLAKLAETRLEINIDRAKKAYEETKAKLVNQDTDDTHTKLLEVKLQRSITRQKTLRKYG